MATSLDVFELLYAHGSLAPKRLLELMHKQPRDYAAVYQLLLRLQKDKLATREKGLFHAARSPRARQLYALVRYCINNGINYNHLVTEGMARFVRRALRKRRFSINDTDVNPRTFAAYTDRLSNSGLLIILSRKPMTATLPHSSFLHDLLMHFHQPVPSQGTEKEDYVDVIERELRRFAALRKKNERKYREIIKGYETRFIQHSLNLEGNPITLPETVKLLKEHITPLNASVETVEEVRNYQKAVERMLNDAERKTPLTKEHILAYHALAMAHRQDIAGQIRTIPVKIRNNPRFKTASPKDIHRLLNDLLARYNEFLRKSKHTLRETIAFASYFHNGFQHIHPFIDGNSRTTRLLTFHLLRSLGIPVLDIPLGLLEEYVFTTKGAATRNDAQHSIVLQRIILANLRGINKQL